MNIPSLNRRHKFGLFLVLVATGFSLLLEASARQTAGVILLGVAATWLIGSSSVRALWAFSSLLACSVGIFVAGKPILDGWESSCASVKSFDHGVADLREAVVLAKKWKPVDYDALAKQTGAISSTRTPPLPPGYTLDQPEPSSLQAPARTQNFTDIHPLPGLVDYDSKAKKWMPVIDFSAYETADNKQKDWFERNAPPRRGQYTAADIDRGTTIAIPTSTQAWERSNFRGEESPNQKRDTPDTLPEDFFSAPIATTLIFPSGVDEEELISTIQNQLLQPRPHFSMRACISSNTLSSLVGLAIVVAGLFSLGGFFRSRLGAT